MNVTTALIVFCSALSGVMPSSVRAGPKLTLHVDEDLFSGMGSDADYTGGLAMTLADELFAAKQSAPAWIENFDNALGVNAENYGYEVELGAAAFTPLRIADSEVVRGDRPYAGIVYVSATLLRSDGAQFAATTLAVGMLGSELIPAAQRRIHRAMGSDQPRGWTHQVSDGGELTLRVTHEVARSSPAIDLGHVSAQWLYRMGVGAGFLTDVNIGIAARFGQFSDPRWNIHSSPLGLGDRMIFSRSDRSERFWYVTLGARFSVYNVLLQGQFRDSDHTLSGRDCRALVPDASVGFVFEMDNGFDLHYFLRAQRSEARLAERDETSVYAGVALSW